MQAIWNRLAQWLQINAPQLVGELNPGATDAELAELSSTIGVELPADFLAFYRIHNGQRSGGSNLFDGEELLSTDRMLDEWGVWHKLLVSGDFAGSYSEPPAGVRNDWWSPGWLPLTYDGAGNHWCLDVAPAAGGTYGQIIRMWHDDTERPLAATSFREWLTRYVIELEAGAYAFSEEYDGIVPAEYLKEEE